MAFSFAETQLTEKCDNSSTLAPDNTFGGQRVCCYQIKAEETCEKDQPLLLPP